MIHIASAIWQSNRLDKPFRLITDKVKTKLHINRVLLGVQGGFLSQSKKYLKWCALWCRLDKDMIQFSLQDKAPQVNIVLAKTLDLKIFNGFHRTLLTRGALS
jgi:hypothetical protein